MWLQLYSLAVTSGTEAPVAQRHRAATRLFLTFYLYLVLEIIYCYRYNALYITLGYP